MSNTKSEIKNIIMDFSNENLNEEYTNKSLEILDKLEDANAEILGTSRTDIWAASILNIVLDMNGVFNKKHAMYMTKKDFSQKIGVSAGTIKNKAEAVKEILKIEENDARLIISSADETSEKVEAKTEVVKEEVAETTETPVKEVKNEKEIMYQNFMKLAHESNDFKEKVENFENAIKVAVEMIDNNGEVAYWEDETTKPYMIALQDLGNVLNENKEYKEAKKVYELSETSNHDELEGSLSYLNTKEKEFLAFLLKKQLYVFKPIDISKMIGVTNKTVINRCVKLANNGFLIPVIVKARVCSYRLSEFTRTNEKKILKKIS